MSPFLLFFSISPSLKKKKKKKKKFFFILFYKNNIYLNIYNISMYNNYFTNSVFYYLIVFNKNICITDKRTHY